MQRFQPSFHQHQIRDYSICPKRFYFNHVLGLKPEYKSAKMFFGTVMHRLIAEIHECENPIDTIIKDSAIRNFIERLESESDLPVSWQDRKTEIDGWVVDAVSTLQNYWSKPFNRNTKVLLSEAEFTVKIGHFDFAGRVDQFRRYNGETILIDFKSGQSGVDQTEIDLNYQLSIYAWACKYGKFCENDWRSIGEVPDKMAIYRLQDHLPYKRKTTKNGQVFEKGMERGPGLYFTNRTKEDYNAMIRDLGIICRSIIGPHYDASLNHLSKGGAFGRTPNMANCVSCPFKSECLADRNPIKIETENIKIKQEDLVDG